MKRFLNIVRYKEWFDSKWNIYLYVFLLYWIRHPETDGLVCLKGIVAVIFFSFFFLAFGYAFNEYSDAKEDLMAGKVNFVAQLDKPKQRFLVGSLLALGVAIPICLFPNWGMALIISLSFLMAFLYSYRRFGIKQCGIWGLMVSSIAQRVCPMFVIFYLFDDWSATTVLVTVLSFIIGLRWILIHQAEDQDNDKISHTKSFVVSLNNNESKLLAIITSVFVCELLCLSTILILNASFSWAIIIPIAYVLFQLILLPFWKKIGWKRMILSYDFAPLADFYFLWAGVYATTALSLCNPIYSILFLPVFYFGYRYVILDYKYLILNYKANRGLLSDPTR